MTKNIVTALGLLLLLGTGHPATAQTFSDYLSTAETKFNSGDYSGAIEDCSKAIELNPENAIAYYNRGGAKLRQENYRGAIEDYSKVIELNPEFVIAYYNRGNARYALEDYRGAIGDYTKALVLSKLLLTTTEEMLNMH